MSNRRLLIATCLATCLGLATSLIAPAGEPPNTPDGAWPKWRQVMTSPNTIYDISDNTLASLKFVFPGGKPASQFTNADDGHQGTGASIYGYGGGTLLRGVGPCGVLVFGSGGENFAGNMTGVLDLNADVAHYDVWQQPIYSLKPGRGAEFYWNAAEAESLPENRRFALLKFDKAKWDGGFPVAIGGWVYPAPVKYFEVADQVPLGLYRYDQHCYIPAAYTGLGTGVWFIPNVHFMAPGSYYAMDKALCTDFWPSGKKRWYSHYQREDTKAWTRVSAPAPESVGPGTFSNQVVGFSAKHKKVVVPWQGVNGDTGVFDLSDGVEKGTWSVKPSPKKGSGPFGLRCGQKSAMSNGHPRNRAFFVWYVGP